MRREYINKFDLIDSIIDIGLPWEYLGDVLFLIKHFPVKIIEDSIPTEEEIEDMERKDKK